MHLFSGPTFGPIFSPVYTIGPQQSLAPNRAHHPQKLAFSDSLSNQIYGNLYGFIRPNQATDWVAFSLEFMASRMAADILERDKGLETYASIPASKHLVLSPVMAFAVIAIIGTPA